MGGIGSPKRCVGVPSPHICERGLVWKQALGRRNHVKAGRELGFQSNVAGSSQEEEMQGGGLGLRGRDRETGRKDSRSQKPGRRQEGPPERQAAWPCDTCCGSQPPSGLIQSTGEGGCLGG